MFTDLLSVACSACLLTQPRTICLWMAPPTMSWASLHQSLIKKKKAPQIWLQANLREAFLNRDFSPQITLACDKLTKTEKGHPCPWFHFMLFPHESFLPGTKMSSVRLLFSSFVTQSVFLSYTLHFELLLCDPIWGSLCFQMGLQAHFHFSHMTVTSGLGSINSFLFPVFIISFFSV